MEPTPPTNKEPKEFRFRIWPFYLLETKGYTSQENTDLLKSTTSFRRLWLIILCVLILLACTPLDEFFRGMIPDF
jgi:hypothetical protein